MFHVPITLNQNLPLHVGYNINSFKLYFTKNNTQTILPVTEFTRKSRLKDTRAQSRLLVENLKFARFFCSRKYENEQWIRDLLFNGTCLGEVWQTGLAATTLPRTGHKHT